MKLRELFPKVNRPRFLNCPIVFYLKIWCRTIAIIYTDNVPGFRVDEGYGYMFFKKEIEENEAESGCDMFGDIIKIGVRYYTIWKPQVYPDVVECDEWYEDKELMKPLIEEMVLEGI